jgi:hypothetical protein
LLSKSINLFVIKVFEVFVGDLTELLIPFQEQVIRSGHMIVLVSINAFYSVIFLEVVLDQEFQNLRIDWDL